MLDLYNESCKTLLKKNKDNLNKWKNIPCSWIIRQILRGNTPSPKIIYKFNTFHIKISAIFVGRNKQADHKIYMEIEGPRTAK